MMKFIYINFFSLIIVISCFSLMISINPVYSIIHLINVFLNVSILLALKQIEYFCFLFILIYVGAIAILFLFIVMMLNIKLKNVQMVMSKNWSLGILFLVIFLIEILAIINYSFSSLYVNLTETPALFVNWYIFDDLNILTTLGQVLYTNYLFYLLFAGLILLVAIYGSVFLTQGDHMEKDLITTSEKQLGYKHKSMFLFKD